jgi:hypothetical protein
MHHLQLSQCVTDCTDTCAGPREQLNQVSAYLDGSVVYGPSLNLTAQLRSMSGGRLLMSVTPDGRTLLPYSVDASDGCNQKEQNAQGRYCFLSGTSTHSNTGGTVPDMNWVPSHTNACTRFCSTDTSHWGIWNLSLQCQSDADVLSRTQNSGYRGLYCIISVLGVEELPLPKL